MNRTAVGTVLALFVLALAGPGATLAKKYDASSHVCTADDMAVLLAEGIAAAWIDSPEWVNCQFRLYDGNGGKVNLFTTDEYFLGGIFTWLTDSELESLGLSREEGIALLQAAQSTVLWGPAHESKSSLVQLSTNVATYADFDTGGDVLTYILQYHVFEPGSLSPGRYQWRWEYAYVLGHWTDHGEVQIVAP